MHVGALLHLRARTPIRSASRSWRLAARRHAPHHSTGAGSISAAMNCENRRQKSGRSSGLRLETKCRSTTTGGILPNRAGVDQIVLDARRAGDAHAAIHAGRNRDPAAVANRGHQLAGAANSRTSASTCGSRRSLSGMNPPGITTPRKSAACMLARSPRRRGTDSRACRRRSPPASGRPRSPRPRPRCSRNLGYHSSRSS